MALVAFVEVGIPQGDPTAEVDDRGDRPVALT